MMQYPRIQQITLNSDRTLRVEFTNHVVKDYDLTPLLSKPIFTPLGDPAFVKNFTIEPGGYAVVWNDDIDLSEYELWQHGVTVHKQEQSSPIG
ncbi:DUF2442 domain-containing protein [Leptolyngbya sp. PCC 6406]|uniref:DUF2442 domain-containing protein n=1 Tax=Leptolyngbya sp. PCC 6406 TaxID=1173264 RepID=UPI0002ABDE69|nr:DUF2442 domain-containing protein [Leptolyngbya sp. PCC 6406]